MYDALHYQKNWFKLLFVFSRKIITDAKTQMPVLAFKCTLGNNLQIFGGPETKDLTLEARFLRSTPFLWKWDVFKGGAEKPFMRMEFDLAKTAFAFGAEILRITDPKGAPLLLVQHEDKAALKRVADGFTKLYNPIHPYQLKTPEGEPLAKISAKHAFFKTIYDFELLGGKEAERDAALMCFAFFVLNNKK